MDFELTEGQKMTQGLARAFAQDMVLPVVSELDAKDEFPWELIREMSEIGFMGMIIPEEYGGMGADTVSHCLVAEEIARGWASLHLIFSANNSLATAPILRYGTEEQRRRYLPFLAKGQLLGCFALTEPNVGSDAASIECRAEPRGNSWVINGTKTFITNATEADICVLLARTSDDGHRGITAFIVDMRPSAVTVRKIKKMGLKSSPLGEINLVDCIVRKENVLGNIGEGFKIAMTTLDGGRINIGAQAVGIARAAFEEALAYSKQRKQFRQPIFQFQAIQFMLSEMATKIEAARLMVYRAAKFKDEGKPFTKEASQAKLFASEMAVEATLNAIRIFGGIGYTEECNVERHHRDAVATVLYEGTSQIQNLVIANHL